jgi:perosamine synthetase
VRLRDSIGLVPRNNWDYGLDALAGSFRGLRNLAPAAPNAERVFGEKVVWTNSGRAALYAILKALELPPGALVGVPLFCCPVVFNAIRQAGLSPCFLDSDLGDCNLSLSDLEQKRSRLAAVVAVHMFGNPCDVDAISAAVDGIPVIEDCAQSIFSTHKGKQTGFSGTASFFSFRCGKYISAGEGSAIFCEDPDLQDRVERIVSKFETESARQMLLDSLSTYVKATLYNRPWYGLVGHPIGKRLDKKLNLTAKDGFETGKIASTYLGLIDARISDFEAKVNIQRRHARVLADALAPGDFTLVTARKGCSSNWYQFPLKFRNASERDAMADHLLSRGIDTAKYLDGIADEARLNYGYRGDCPNAEHLSSTVLLIPIHYTLNDSDIGHIARSINEGSRQIQYSRAGVAA